MSCEGIIREEDCPAHKHFEWDVVYEALRTSQWVKSPVFKIEEQSCVLQSRLETYMWNPIRGHVYLNLLFIGPHDSKITFTDLCWFGLKSRDGTYCPGCLKTVRKIEVQSALEITFSISLFPVWDCLLTPDNHLTFVFRKNVHRASAVVKACIHEPSPIPAPHFGTIREEDIEVCGCSTHRQVEWEIYYKKSVASSPGFQIGNHVYFLGSCFCSNGDVIVKLFSLGPSLAASVRCWLGLKCANGSYIPKISSTVIDMREDMGLWTEVAYKRYTEQELKKSTLTEDRLLIYLRLNVASTRVETCTHDVVDVAVQVDREKTDSHQDGNLFSTRDVVDVAVQVDREETVSHQDGNLGSTRGAEKVVLDIGKLLKSGELSDVVIKVGNAEFEVHRAILAVRAPVLGAMFQHDTKEKATGEVTIDDCEPDVFEQLLHYIYTGAPRELTAENASAVYTVADKYLLSEVTALCVKRMKDTLGLNNFCDIVTLALIHKEEELLDTAIGFLSGRVLDVLRTVEWQVFSRDHSTWANEILIRAHELQARNGRETSRSD